MYEYELGGYPSSCSSGISAIQHERVGSLLEASHHGATTISKRYMYDSKLKQIRKTNCDIKSAVAADISGIQHERVESL